MRVLKPFDPWGSKICTCGFKLSFNPYTGCAHRCDYCYATYIPRFWEVREKKDLLRKLRKDLEELKGKEVISMSNSSDPYPPIEKERGLTRECLRLFKEFDVKVLVVTKSDLVLRDLDLLSEMNAVISMTITGCDPLEKFAPPSEKRILAFKKIAEVLPVVLRFDPVIPFLNENKLEIIEACEPEHVVTSTLKLRRDSFSRIAKSIPSLKEKLRRLYFVEGEKIGGYWYLKKDLRFGILKKIDEFCNSLGISCAFCREGFEFQAESCDGKHLFKNIFKII
ncbi:MAG: radical SAM protein [Archaeoglobaceae archaeon]|nr:radical SAM protein [Archaeoglobaceae archaeon]MDW8127685.1 radical SAM protein [Archaeoglobaceae archaeon]